MSQIHNSYFLVGFLAAEMFSRYYAKDISMHSYDNGNSAKSKKDNWTQLAKTLRKAGIGTDLLSDEQSHHIASMEEGAAVDFICKAYELLTQRKIQTQVMKPVVGKVAGYQRDISLTKVRKAMQLHDIRDDNDQLRATRIIANVVDDHERRLQQERLNDPERFSSTSSGLTLASRVPKGSQSLGPSFSEDIPSFPSNSNNNQDSDNIRPNNYLAPSQGRRMSAEGVVSPISGAVAEIFDKTIATATKSRKLPGWWSKSAKNVHNFIAAFEYLDLSSSEDGNDQNDLIDLLLSVLSLIELEARPLVAACIQQSNQYTQLVKLFINVISVANPMSSPYRNACITFEAIGSELKRALSSDEGILSDDKTSIASLADQVVSLFSPILNGQPAKRVELLQCMYSHEDDLLRMIHRLKPFMADQHSFIHCLSILATHPILNSSMTIELLDLYSYYADIALALPSPKMRVCGVAMIASLLQWRYDKILDQSKSMLPSLVNMARSETWWEIQAHMLTIGGRLLQQSSTTKLDDASIEMILNIITAIFTTKESTSRNIRLWGLNVLAPVCGWSEALSTLYLTVLLLLDDNDRKELLSLPIETDQAVSQASSIQLPSSIGVKLVVETGAVARVWNALSIAKAMTRSVAAEKESIDRLTMEQMQVLYACIQTTYTNQSSSAVNASISLLSIDEPLSEEWLEIFKLLKDYIFVALCDPSAAACANGILSAFIFGSNLRETIFLDPMLVSTLRLLFHGVKGEEDHISQQSLIQFLRDVFSVGPPYSQGVATVVRQFSVSYPEQFEQSQDLQQLMQFCSQ